MKRSKIKLPRKTKQWADEAARALDLAWKFAEEEHGELNQSAREKLYKYGPMLCAKNRGIKDKNQEKGMAEYAFRDRLADFKVEPDSVKHYSINFLLAYLDSHVYLNLLTEHNVHEIMEYIVDHFMISE